MLQTSYMTNTPTNKHTQTDKIKNRPKQTGENKMDSVTLKYTLISPFSRVIMIFFLHLEIHKLVGCVEGEN